MNQLIKAALDTYQAQRTEALAHLDLLFNDATMIGEHTDLLTEVKKWTESLATAEDCLGTLDKIFGFFFGFLRSYVICVCIFSTISIIYNYEKWPIDFEKSFTFSYVEKGSNYLIKEFPNKKNYEDAKDKVTDI